MLNNLSPKLKLLTYAGIVVLVILISIIAYLLIPNKSINTNKKPAYSVSPDILFLTQPVYYFLGKVENVSGSVVTVSQNFTLSQNTPAPLPTPVSKTLKYEVTVNINTSITQPSAMVNYLFKNTPPPAQLKLNIKNIKAGQYVMVNSKEDLRALPENKFTAVSVQLSQPVNSLWGKIIKVYDNGIVLKAQEPRRGTLVPNTTPGKEKEFIITLNSDTEISRYETSAPPTNPAEIKPLKPVKMSLSDLKENTQITVYTAEDVIESKELTALRIEPILPSPSATPAQPSPQ